jgi:hypothetical protein
MPSAVKGAASPWFTSAGSDLLVVKELKVSFKLQLADQGQTGGTFSRSKTSVDPKRVPAVNFPYQGLLVQIYIQCYGSCSQPQPWCSIFPPTEVKGKC